MGQVIVVTSGKGGTGKTTLCAGLGSALSQRKQKVLCIDADIGLRNLDLALGMADTATVAFTEVLADRIPLERAPTHPALPSLQLLTSPTAESEIHSEGFRQMLCQARTCYDWILIDAPAGIGSGFHLSAAYADRALVVATADPASLRDAGRAAQLLRQLGLPQQHLAVNRVSRKLFHKIGSTIDDMMDQIGLPLLGLVPEDPKVVLAAVTGTALLHYTDRGAAAAMHNMARRLLFESVPLMRIR